MILNEDDNCESPNSGRKKEKIKRSRTRILSNSNQKPNITDNQIKKRNHTIVWRHHRELIKENEKKNHGCINARREGTKMKYNIFINALIQAP